MAAKITNTKQTSGSERLSKSFRIDSNLLREIDEWCKDHDRSHSWVISRLVRMAWPDFKAKQLRDASQKAASTSTKSDER